MEVEPLRILLIEDDREDAQVIEWCLAESPDAPIEMEQAQRLTTGLARLAERPFDVVLLDLGLPESVGLETLREVRRQYADVPIVVLTGLTLAETAVEAMKAGADDYLIKGQFHGRQLMRAVRFALERSARRRAEEELRATNQALRAMASKLTMAEQQERRRLSRLVHEHLQQLLAAVRLKVDTLRRRSQSAALDPCLGEIECLLVQCLEESRHLTQELSPPVLHDAGLTAALAWLSRHVQRRHGLCLELKLDARAEPESEEIRILVFQAVCELLANVIHHAGVRQATVAMARVDGNRLEVQVTDAGVGFDPSKTDVPGLGGSPVLFSLRERLQALGGDLEVRSVPGDGTRAVVLAPLSIRTVAGANA
jgi:signal transduction histidine kinase